jgi:hypothetical protein
MFSFYPLEIGDPGVDTLAALVVHYLGRLRTTPKQKMPSLLVFPTLRHINTRRADNVAIYFDTNDSNDLRRLN